MGERSLKDEFWSIATNLHIGLLKQLSALDFQQVLLEAKKQSVPFSWRDIDPVIRKTNRSDIPSVPNRVVDFIASYCHQVGGKTVFDPWANIGVLLLSLQEKMEVKSTAIMRRSEDIKIAELFDPKDIQWLLKIAEEDFVVAHDRYDLIVSVPAFGLPHQQKSYKLPAGELQIKDSATYLLLLSACQHLSEKGKAIFLLPEGFYGRDQIDNVVNNLGEFGLYINAIVSLPPNTFQPATGVGTALFFISREETFELFIGHLSDEVNEASLLKNLIRRKNGSILETGQLVNREEYKSWRQYSLLVEIQEIVKHSKLPIIKLEEIALKFNFGKKGEDNGFEEIPNAFFLPLLENLPVLSDSADITNPTHYVQIALKPELALADYVAGYFSTEAGKKVRASLASGNVITRISNLDLFDAFVLLPEIEMQQQVIETHRTMRELSYQLQKFEKDLYKRPDQVEKIRKDIQKLDQKESFNNWIESLPFPMASILRRYQASAEIDKKLEHLLQFFEATAEFIAIILLSAYLSDSSTMSTYQDIVFPKKVEKRGDIKVSTFGYWVKTGERLAKQTRTMLGSPNERSICFELFHTSSVEFIQTISGKNLFDTLNRAAGIRNRDAHSGIKVDLSNSKRLSLAESELDKLRSIFSSIFEDIILFAPLSNQYRDGVFTNKITKLNGPHQIFIQDYIKTIIPLDAEKLYLSEKHEKKPLELLPFIKMLKSPESEKIACYFYSRMEGQTPAWVSYHYEGQPEIELEDQELLKVIKLFEN
jgi:hypothetical protein